MNFIKTIKEIALIIIVVVGIFGLFMLQGILEQVDYEDNLENELTGEVIQVGKPDPNIIINGDKKLPKKEYPKTKVITNKNLICWVDAGVKIDDLRVIGNLLQTTKCQEIRERKEVKASVRDKCILFDVEGNAITNICVDEEVPKFNIELPSKGEGYVDIPKVKRNYLPPILFVIILILTFGIWSWDEMRYGVRKKHHKLYQGYLKEVEEPEEEKIPEEIEGIYKKFVKGKISKHRLNKKDLARAINNFNTLAHKLFGIIKKNDLENAKITYNQLNDVFQKLLNSVDLENKKMILEVINYFNKQIILLEKSKRVSHLIKEAYRDSEKHKVVRKKEVIKEEKLPKDLEDNLEHLKKILKKSEDKGGLKKYKKLFTTPK